MFFLGENITHACIVSCSFFFFSELYHWFLNVLQKYEFSNESSSVSHQNTLCVLELSQMCRMHFRPPTLFTVLFTSHLLLGSFQQLCEEWCETFSGAVCCRASPQDTFKDILKVILKVHAACQWRLHAYIKQIQLLKSLSVSSYFVRYHLR